MMHRGICTARELMLRRVVPGCLRFVASTEGGTMQHVEHIFISFLLVSVALLVPHSVHAQSDFLSGESYLMSHWGVIEGLPSMDAWPMLQTRDGYVWIAKEESGPPPPEVCSGSFNRSSLC
jgi:hypothetical protein